LIADSLKPLPARSTTFWPVADWSSRTNTFGVIACHEARLKASAST
jgi:hypothetical protein